MKSLRQRLVRFSTPLLILALGGLIAFYFIKSRPDAEPRTGSEIARPVHVVDVHYRDLTPKITNYGEVLANREAEIRAMVSGRLVWIADEFKDGAIITAGKKLAQIDPFDYELALSQSQANLAEAQARVQEIKSERESEWRLLQLASDQINLRERDRDRSKNLSQKGQASKKALDDSSIALNAALELRVQRQQAVAGLDAKINQQQAIVQRLTAALQQAERNLEDTTIVAPFDGYVAGTGVALGKRLAIGESLSRLISADDLQVRFQLKNDDYARLISQGSSDALFSREVAVVWRLGHESLHFKGLVERSAAEIDPASGGVTVYASIDNDVERGANLRPGAFVEVRLDDVRYAHVFELPSEAVFDGGSVFTVRDGRLHEAPVEVVRYLAGNVIVRADLPEGTQVVATPFAEIGPGMLVRVVGTLGS